MQGLSFEKMIILPVTSEYIINKTRLVEALNATQYNKLVNEYPEIVKQCKKYIRKYMSLVRRGIDPSQMTPFRYSTLRYFHREPMLENDNDTRRTRSEGLTR